MAQQIVITSLEKTLTGGSGYGLAGASPNIPDPVRKRILSLAGYGFVRRSPSPVNWVGLRWETSSGPIGVLGRIAEAPNDYSGRDNFIAHFLLMQASETAAYHPGQILDRFAWITTWSGPARLLDPPRLPTGVPAYPFSPSPWEKAAGDRGFAGCAWDCLDAGKKLLFTHDQLDANQLKALVVETLSMAPVPRAWNLGFATHAEDYPEAQRCALLGTHGQSRLAQKWDLDGVPHLNLPAEAGAPPLLAPPGNGVNQARKSLFLLPEVRQARTTKTRSRSTGSSGQHEIFVDAEVLVASQAWPDAVPPPLNDLPPPAPETADPMKMVFPGAIGFFAGAIGTAALFSLVLLFFQPGRDKDAKGNQAGPGNGNANGAEPEKAEKKAEANNEGKDKGGPPAPGGGEIGPPQNGNPPQNPIEPIGQLLAQPIRAIAGVAELFRMPDGIGQAKDQWARQRLILSHLQNMPDWKADERALLRPDRFFILVRQLEAEKPRAPDPFTFEHLDQLKAPIDEIVWIMEGSRLAKSNRRSSALALLSLIANQDRVHAKWEELSKKQAEKDPKKPKFDTAFWRDHVEEFKKKLSKDDFDALNANFADTLKARLDDMRQTLEKYKNP